MKLKVNKIEVIYINDAIAWVGKVPNPGQQVIVFRKDDKEAFVDTWVEDNREHGFKNIDVCEDDILYWMPLPLTEVE